MDELLDFHLPNYKPASINELIVGPKDNNLDDNSMNKVIIKRIALASGFKLKKQPDGSDDLNPYVYDFARVLLVNGAFLTSDDIDEMRKKAFSDDNK